MIREQAHIQNPNILKGILEKIDAGPDEEDEKKEDVARAKVLPWEDALLEAFRRSKMGMINFTRCESLVRAVCDISSSAMCF